MERNKSHNNYILMHKDTAVLWFDLIGRVKILNKKLYLYKDGNKNEVKNEVLASKIISCFNVKHVNYELKKYKGDYVSCCELITNHNQSLLNKWT